MVEYKGLCQKCWKKVVPLFQVRNTYCNCTFKLATIEHKMPRCLGGSNQLFNLTLYCEECNNRGSKTVSQNWHKRIKRRMKQLFTIADVVVIEDSIVDHQKQIGVYDTTKKLIQKITIPIALQDIRLYLGRDLKANEYIIDPMLDYAKLFLQTGFFENTGSVLPLKYKVFQIWILKP